MKYLSKQILLATTLLLLSLSPMHSQEFLSNTVTRNLAEASSRCIIAYENCNYMGAYQEICSDQEFFSFSFAVSSIKVASNTVATLYSSTSYSGQSLDISSNVSCLTGDYGFND